jgi:hypothetical protein
MQHDVQEANGIATMQEHTAGAEIAARSGRAWEGSRRGAFALLGGALGAALVQSRMRSARAIAQPVATAPMDVDPSSDALLAKLVDRITFGATLSELTLARTLGYEGYLEYHLNPAAIADPDVDSRLVNYPVLTQNYAQLRTTGITQTRLQLMEARLMRALLSKRQLFERIVDFWTNHFAIFIFENDDSGYFKVADDANVVRAHALGTFPNMLIASAHSPAMLYYLDNTASTALAPNENYAREVMELHTLGVTGPYTQNDVVELSKIMSGWAVDRRQAEPTYGQFRYISSNHNNQPKLFLGVLFPGNQGQAEGDQALVMLHQHPSTAQYIASKLCLEFLGENTPAEVVNDVAATYTATGGDIKAMVRRVLRPERLAAAPLKLKRPMHLLISGLRTLPLTVNNLTGVRNQLQPVQNQPFAWGAPDGYPDKAAYWSGNVLPRLNFGSTIGSNGVSGILADYFGFFTGSEGSPEMVADRINERVLMGRMTQVEREELIAYMGPGATTATDRTDALALTIGGPTFQWF